MSKITINCGPLTSFNSVNLYVGSSLSDILKLKKDGFSPEVNWDLSNIGQISLQNFNTPKPVKVSISALCALLSIATSLRYRILGYAPMAKLKHDAIILGFLYDTKFKELADLFDVFNWESLMFENVNKESINPDTKIDFFNEIPYFPYNTPLESIEEWKNEKRVEIKHSLKNRFSSIFDLNYLPAAWTNDLETTLLRVTSELIVNGLLHGEDTTFIGMQRTSYGITISICDSGNGLIRSLKKWYSFLSRESISYVQAIVISSFINKNRAGLFLGIEEVIKLNGWVTISSNRCEVRWEESLWENAKANIANINLIEGLPNLQFMQNFQVTGIIPKEFLQYGYYKYYPYDIPGVKISFHIPFSR